MEYKLIGNNPDIHLEVMANLHSYQAYGIFLKDACDDLSVSED